MPINPIFSTLATQNVKFAPQQPSKVDFEAVKAASDQSAKTAFPVDIVDVKKTPLTQTTPIVAAFTPAETPDLGASPAVVPLLPQQTPVADVETEVAGISPDTNSVSTPGNTDETVASTSPEVIPLLPRDPSYLDQIQFLTEKFHTDLNDLLSSGQAGGVLDLIQNYLRSIAALNELTPVPTPTPTIVEDAVAPTQAETTLTTPQVTGAGNTANTVASEPPATTTNTEAPVSPSVAGSIIGNGGVSAAPRTPAFKSVTAYQNVSLQLDFQLLKSTNKLLA